MDSLMFLYIALASVYSFLWASAEISQKISLEKTPSYYPLFMQQQQSLPMIFDQVPDAFSMMNRTIKMKTKKL